METMLYWCKRLLPRQLLSLLRPPYHYALAKLAAIYYRHPSRDITVIAVTGTKGKSSVVELIANIFKADNKKIAVLSTIHFVIDEEERKNLYKMSTPGRFFIQRFIREAVEAGCSHVIIELTSEAAKQYRHTFIEIDALVFTNLTPEHIESHGSFENYKNAKLSIAQRVADSGKQPRYLIANTDDEHGTDFLNFKVEEKIPYGLSDLKLYTLHKDSISLVIASGDEETTLRAPLVGLFNVYNTLAAIKTALAFNISLEVIEKALRDQAPIKGRVEIFRSPGHYSKKVTAVVDYAHTTDSLTKLYEAFPNIYKIGVLGNTGGGRDKWKRPEMGAIAETYCDQVILTNEDPYDEDPREIVEDMKKGFTDQSKAEIIMDRRLAIATALENCPDGGYVIISGKGTDPYIMGPHNSKEKWSDAKVVQEELAKLTN